MKHKLNKDPEKTNATISKMVVACLLGMVLVIAIGCQTNQPSSPTTVIDTDPLTATNRYGLSLGDAHDKSLKLAPGMTQDDVVSLLSKPDETSAHTFGSQTAKPWNGIMWIYHWGPGIYRFKGPNPHDTLTVIFEQGSNAWIVNSWQWSGP